MTISILEVKGVGPSTAEHLSAAGINTVEALAALTVKQLVGFPRFGEFRARQVIEHAKELLAQATLELADDKPAVAVENPPAEKAGKKKKTSKKKEGKKSKKSKKDKDKKVKKGKLKKEKGKKAKTKKASGKKKAKKKKK